MAGPRKAGPPGHHQHHHHKPPKFQRLWNKFVRPAVDEIYSLVVDPSRAHVIAIILLFVEVVVNVVVIEKVPYTEIDWKAYMQEVEGVIVNGTYDYSLLKGDTGPLVYPAGFVWFYAALYKLTDSGTNIRLGEQCWAKVKHSEYPMDPMADGSLITKPDKQQLLLFTNTERHHRAFTAYTEVS